jgi:4-hydroxybenzoate polyprenyltransferase
VNAIRPEFEPDDEDDSPALPRRTSLTLAWLRLMRLPNVFTAIADVAMGYLFVHGSPVAPIKLATLIAASAMLYTAGMVLNDVFDIDVDRKERPFRPLPSGRISLGVARAFGFTLLVLGVGCGWLAGFVDPGNVAVPLRSGLIATILAGCILLYNGVLKSTPGGPIVMGLCRFLNVLLGMSASPRIWHDFLFYYSSPELLAAAGIGIYIVGVTIFARGEAATSKGLTLLNAIIVMACGAVVLAVSIPLGAPWRLGIPYTMYWLLLGLLMVTVLRGCLTAAFDPTPERVQAAVKHSILSLIWLDAATAVVVSSPASAVAIAALLIPALLLGRWVYST